MKKIISIILVALFLVSSLAICAVAADSTTVGYSASNVVKPTNLSEVRNILDIDTYPEETAYKVNSPEGLLRVATAVKQDFYDFADVTIYLTKDVDMTGITWTPIGTANESFFAGTFDGLGHVISNLVYENKYDGTAVTVTGLFGVTKGATLKNIVLASDCSFKFTGNGSSDNRTGSLIGWAGSGAKTETNIENCYSAATVVGSKYTGGLIGQHDGNGGTQFNIKNTTFAGSVTSPGCAGGFCAFFQGKVKVENCLNAGTVTSTTKAVDTWNAVGGFVGRARPRGTELDSYAFKNCVNTGTLTGGAVGGILGGAEINVKTIKLEGCVNYGTLNAGESLNSVAVQNAIYAINTPSSPGVEGDMPATDTSCLDKTGQSSGLTLPTITPDYTVEDGASVATPEPGDTSDGGENDDTSDSKNTDTEAAATDTRAEATDTKAESTDTEAAADDTTPAEEGGCGSVIGGGAVAIVLAGAVFAVRRKKED